MKKTLIISTFLISVFVIGSPFLTFASQPLMNTSNIRLYTGTNNPNNYSSFGDTPYFAIPAIITPKYENGTTGLVLYLMDDQDNYYIASANLMDRLEKNSQYFGMNQLTFSDLLRPMVDLIGYPSNTIHGILMEYIARENGQNVYEDCSVLIPEQCQNNPAFLSRFDFGVADNNTISSISTVATSTATSTTETASTSLLADILSGITDALLPITIPDNTSTTTPVDNTVPISQEPEPNNDIATSTATSTIATSTAPIIQEPEPIQ